MVTISVALCTFNGARFVKQQLQSILEQSRLPDEIIISDDGSTDDTVDIVRVVLSDADYPATSVRILEEGTNRGVTANFERAVQACTGELIVLSDQDDVWHRDRLSEAVSYFDKPALLLQHSDARLVDAEGVPLGVSLFEALTISAAERKAIAIGDAFHAYIRRNLATGATMMFRSSLLANALPFPSAWVHDEWLAVIAAAVGEVQMLEKPLIDYRQHGRNHIGARKPTFRYRVGRMLEPRGERYTQLAARSQALCDRLEDIPASETIRQIARDRARFDDVRSGLPRSRWARLGTVLREWRAGSYTRLSSQGQLDVVRDLLQPAGNRTQTVR